jgi:Uma2 family endonuclease
MGMAAQTYYTADMVRALPDDGNRYETVHGELLVTPAPRLTHQRVVGRLHVALSAYLERHPVGEVLLSPADISWSPDTLVQPDLFVAPWEETRTLDWASVRTLLLVVEVTSPSSQRADRFTKRRLYEEVGVPAYWVVDLDQQAIEVWTPEAIAPTVERERVIWTPAGAGAPFTLEPRELFRPV